MDLEKKLEQYYEINIVDNIKICESTNDFSKIRMGPYDYFYSQDEFLKDYFSIEDEKLKKRYEHLMKIFIYGKDKKGEYGYRYVIFDYIVNRDFEKPLRYLTYEYDKKYKEYSRTLNGEGSIYKVFDDFNKYFSKEFYEYTDKYVDIINNNDNKKILKKNGQRCCNTIDCNMFCDKK